ncbi:MULTISPECIES: OmpA family protein [Pseudoalteromonas]|uniref:OmpA family protein n=1 Tax=Pseudoalteromonas rubra TaxID=43658 RepID=A0A5S3V0N2_9GAMM|nr:MULTISPECIES: OmpA family protein [Pseudoalteromonas]MCG7562128.1 OmpA family protein [Pseudoalteromonas sp. McH1-42]QPB85065.1 OmpA family protein [Pseudoalteromonas rubra]
MKLRMLSVVVTALMATSAYADDHQEGVYLGVFGDYYNAEWENSRDAAGVTVDDSMGWGAELGYRFSKYWSARLEYADMDFDLSGLRSDSVDGDRIGIDGLYHFNGGPFYALFGLKSIDVFDNNTFANVGAGYRHHFSDNFAANFETAIYQGIDRGYTDVGAKLGINYFFGGASSSKPVEPAPAPQPEPEPVVAAPVDTDKDGIYDMDDQCANTPMSDAVDAQGCTLYEDKEVTVSLLVRFPNNNSSVSQQYLNDIQAVVSFLNEHPETTVVLEGHTSAVGKADYNKWLSKKRADAVAKQLIEKGIDEMRITTVGYGEERLKNTDDSAQAHAENRRVEAKVKSVERVKVKR